MSTSSSSITASTVVYLITGTNRGIGYGLTKGLAGRPNTLVYATARDPSKADKLHQLAKQHHNVRVVQLRVDSDTDHQAAVKQVEADAGRVDVLLANAGIANEHAYQPSESLALDQLREHFEVNTIGPVRLFSAFLPLLKRSSNPKFVVVSSTGGSIASQAGMPGFYVSTYGASKAAINLIVQRIHLEHRNITSFPLHPGWVQTDMGNTGAGVAGMKQAPMTVEQSVTGIVKLLDDSTRETHSGKFWNAEDGKELPW